ncbi:MAG: hypothetical protein IPI48_06460 [bacterium]|nr:hypothetical protein [bacterium]
MKPASLLRTSPRTPPAKHVHRQAHHLNAQEDREQVRGRGQHHHAEDREQQQRVELGAVARIAVEGGAREDGRQHAATGEQVVEEAGVVPDRHHAGHDLAVAGAAAGQLRQDGAQQDQQRQEGQVVLLLRTDEGVHEHDDEPAAGYDQVRQQDIDLAADRRRNESVHHCISALPNTNRPCPSGRSSAGISTEAPWP